MLQPKVSGRVTLAVLATVILSVLNISCATDQASKLRTDKHYSIGSDLSLSVLGGEYRPPSNPNLGIDFGVSRVPHGIGYSQLTRPMRLLFSALEDAIRDTKATGQTIDLGASWFPFKTSAFRIGLHLSFEQAQVEFNAISKDENTSSVNPRVKYERQSGYLGIPVGWHWIWENGFTWAVDVGPRLRVTTKKTIKDDGGSTVDTTDRDQYIKRTEDSRKVLYGGLIVYLGYSF